ncbi:extracellular solute-binding protein [Roseiarcaceae bacterium H3SJ34-1]|uniref:ABC transporter substrate-binding protein n=1 Tax=Terripilifer ovatus TaxID=3032367 RepID=UPI003AB986CC|nr:extracellular solute-binding protein [Roseiarcaceae bacterium H3SJ34-1]
MNLRGFIAAFATSIIALGAHAQSGPTPAAWDKLVAAAKTEGTVTLYTGLVGNQTTKKIAAAFQQKYGIRMDILEVRATELYERLRADKVANRVLSDVINTSGLQTRQFNEDGIVEKYGELPGLAAIIKDVRDIWEDQDIHVPIFTLRYGLLVNTQLAPDAPKTFADLLDPKWKGKILADDFRAAGGGQTFFSVTLRKFGRAFHEKLAAQNVVFMRETREAERRIARGEFAIYLPFLLNNLPALKGLPVKAVVLDEGVTYTPYSASLTKSGPHPNAGRLLMAFMISPEAQALYAADGLGTVIDGVSGSVPADLQSLGQPKLLGARIRSDDETAFAIAKELYK